MDPLERLIDGVQNHPVLYRIKGRKRLRKQKEGLWEEVGQLCGLSGVEARTSFEATRKRYNKERKTANQTNWKYFDRMKFLDAVIRPRATKHEVRLLRGDLSTKDTKTEAYQLIELVKAHPELYEAGLELDVDVNRKLWEKIGEALGSTAGDEKEKFKILRSRFDTEQRTLEKDPSFRSNWPYYEKLLFLANSVNTKEHIERHSEDTELLVDSLIGRSSVEQFESNTICRFCALENVEMIATACVPHSSIAQLFEYVTNIKLTFSSAFPLHVCTVCEEQLQIAHRIQQKFLEIDEYWHGKSITFATVILNDPTAEFEIKLEKPECEIENAFEQIRPVVIESNETVAPPPSDNVELRIEKVKKVKSIKVTSIAADRSSTFFCYMCDRSFFNESSFKRHNAHTHKQQGPFSCDYCAKEFVKKKHMEMHMGSTHTTYQCKDCSKQFTTSIRLDRHEKRMHDRQPKEVISCNECNKIFRNKHVVANHIRNVHRNLTDHACPICSKVFSSLFRMRDHFNNHRRQRDKACPHCPSKFFRQVDLKIHIRIHTNERPYCCEVCAKTFKTMGELRLHFGRMHGPKSGVKAQRSVGYLDGGPFKCGVCGCSFKVHKSLHNHLLAVHPYVAQAEWINVSQRICKPCNQIFDSVEAAKQHFCIGRIKES